MTEGTIDPRALYERAQKAYEQGDYTEAQSVLEPALEFFLKSKDNLQTAEVGTMLGHIAQKQGNLTLALNRYTQVLEAARQIDDKHIEATTLGDLGIVYADLGDTRKAIEVYEQALVLSRKIKDRRGEADVLSNLGLAYFALGETSKAIELYEQTLVISREVGDKTSEAVALSNLGTAYASFNDVPKEIEFLEQAIAIVRQIGDRLSEAHILGNIGLAYFALGETNKAIELLEQALAISREVSDKGSVANILYQLAQIFAQSDRLADATRYANEALDLYQVIGDSSNIEKVNQILEQIQQKPTESEAGQTHQQLENRAREWINHGRGKDELLDSHELQDAVALLLDKPEEISVSLKEFVDASQVTIQQGKHRKGQSKQDKETSDVSDTLGSSRMYQSPTIPDEISSRLSTSAHNAIRIAENLRQQIQNPDGGLLFTEYLLIGLNELPNEAPRALFTAFGLDATRIVASLASSQKWQLPTEISYSEVKISAGELASLPYSENTRKVFEAALQFSQEKGSKEIRVRHLLAALLEVESSVVYTWMIDMGIPIELVRGTLKRTSESQTITPDMFAYAPGVASADLEAEKDTLGFDPYAQALAEIIIKKETVPPVVFGIYGPWGSGKSTFMSFVKKHLERWDKERQNEKAKATFSLDWLFKRQPYNGEVNALPDDSPRILCVAFNAWAYTDATKLWTGLVRNISQKLDEHIRWWQRPLYWLKKTSWQFAGAVLLSLLPVVIGIGAAFVNPFWDWLENLDVIRDFVKFFVGLLGLFSSIKLVNNQKPLTDIVKSELSKLDHTEVEGIINRIKNSIHETVEHYFKLTEEDSKASITEESIKGEVRRQKKLKLVVFIDELDRCPLEKIVDILESIKLFLAEEIFIVLLAVDTRVAAEAIRLHYIAVNNPELAHEYLEKIIQVPIPVPSAKKKNLEIYLDGMMSIKEKKEFPNIKKLPVLRPAPKLSINITRAPVPPSPKPFKPFNLEDTSDEKNAIISFSEKYISSNPRRIKRLLNTYRYVKILATRQGARTDRGDWQINMIQWLGITMCWPMFIEEGINQVESKKRVTAKFWSNVAKKIPEKIRPPSDIFALLPSTGEDLQALADLASNFIKENPPRPDSTGKTP